MNSEHDIFVEIWWRDYDSVGLAVQCSCGEILLESIDSQLSLDDLVDIAWGHRDE